METLIKFIEINEIVVNVKLLLELKEFLLKNQELLNNDQYDMILYEALKNNKDKYIEPLPTTERCVAGWVLFLFDRSNYPTNIKGYKFIFSRAQEILELNYHQAVTLFLREYEGSVIPTIENLIKQETLKNNETETGNY